MIAPVAALRSSRGDASGDAMVRRAYQQRSLIDVLLPDADKLWDPTLRRIDELLEEDGLVELIADTSARRHPQSARLAFQDSDALARQRGRTRLRCADRSTRGTT